MTKAKTSVELFGTNTKPIPMPKPRCKPCPFCGREMYHAEQNYYWRCNSESCFMHTHFVSESEVGAFNKRRTYE